jgi:enamine deaminase RidA (YjgF/YER057c/UK114 family)
MKEWLKQNKKNVMLIVSGVIGLASAAIGLSDDLQQQIVNIIASFM